MSNPIKRIVIVGGGSAGWLTACVLAAEHKPNPEISVTLVESPDIQHIGVGEGTWPSMKATLDRIGLDEKQFLTYCQASFKQGSQFVDWGCGTSPDVYHHPFMAPATADESHTALFWQASAVAKSFADTVSPQPAIIEQGLAPKQIATPDFAFVANYGYHLDAGKFVELLTHHGKTHLNITHVLDSVTAIDDDPETGDIRAVVGQRQGPISGDLFIDCTGFHSRLLGQHYGVEFLEQKSVLFNDRAIAAQVPYSDPAQPIASATLSTAQKAGWVWDIGLQNRRGIGYVYSSSHCDDSKAEQTLRAYIANSGGDIPDTLRTISIRPGYRAHFWQNNCVAVGMSAGFIEPLEASALVMVEMAAQYIAEQLPADRSEMAITSQRYNECFLHRWQQIIEFLKLHYVLSAREDSDYWRDNKAPASIPDSLQEKLTRWQTLSPSHYDFTGSRELFPAASYQYIYYGMSGKTQPRPSSRLLSQQQAMQKLWQDNVTKTKQWVKGLPTNRELLNQIQSQAQTP